MAAKLCGIQPQTLRQWRTQGRGPEFILLGNQRGRVAYDPRAIEAWIAAQTRRSTADPGGAK